MTENKRFLIGDAGELIDLNNHKFIDYGDECCKLLNELHDENEELKQQKDKWKQQCIHFKEMLDDMDIAYLCDEWIYGELKGDLE